MSPRTLSAAVAATLVCVWLSAPTSRGTEVDAGFEDSGETMLQPDWVDSSVDPLDMQERLAVAEARSQELAKSLAVSNAEREVYRRQCDEMRLRLEAVGAEFGATPNRLEQRLLRATNEVRLLRGRQERLSGAIVRLSDSIVSTLKDSDVLPTLTPHIEKAMAVASEKITATASNASQSPAERFTVLDVKDDLSLAVVSAGRNIGLKVGAPLDVHRNGTPIGTLRVVEVRNQIAGAVVQNVTENYRLQVGDRVSLAVYH